MAELAFWQLAAGTIAAVLSLIAVVALVRLTQMSMVVLVVSLLALPILGLATFAISPGPVQDVNLFLLAGPFVGLAFVGVAGSIAVRLRAGSSPSFGSMHQPVSAFLLAWPCLVIAISTFVYLFEPAIAIANIAVNTVWFAIWALPAMRRSDRESSYEIAAPRERVYAFVTNPANWPLYNPGVGSVAVQPEGPLAVGSRVTFRQRLAYPGLRGPRLLMPQTVDITSEITSLIPDHVLATRRVDLPDSSDVVELASVEGGTRVTGRVHNLIAYRYAVFGARVASLMNRSKRDALIAQRQARLKQLLEQP